MERDVGFAASFGDVDVGNTNFVGQFDHRRLPYFFKQLRNGEAYERVHAVGYHRWHRIENDQTSRAEAEADPQSYLL